MKDDKIKITKKVSTFVREKRMALGLTQVQLAVLVFDDPKKRTWVSQIELGRPITLTTVERIFEKLNADINIIEY